MNMCSSIRKNDYKLLYNRKKFNIGISLDIKRFRKLCWVICISRQKHLDFRECENYSEEP